MDHRRISGVAAGCQRVQGLSSQPVPANEAVHLAEDRVGRCRVGVRRQAGLPVSRRAWTHAAGATANRDPGACGERTIATGRR
jgi:hypothetical protein